MVADSQKQGKAHSGGQRIDDHSFWAGGRSAHSVFPDGPHKSKQEHSASMAGSEMDYEDSTEKIKSMQDMNSSKALSHPQKALYRN